jgi:hypothetical protein
VPLGTSVYDTATTQNGGFPLTGTVTFEYYKNLTCTGTADASDSGKSVGAKSFTQGPLGAGSHAFRAKYVAGDDPNHNDSAWSACEPFTVSKATPTISTTVRDKDGHLIDNTHPAATTTTVHDTATLAGKVGSFSLNGSATVTYSLFTNNTCTTPANGTESVTVRADESVPDSAAKSLGAGSYSYRATYNGNGNYNAATGACEPFKVIQKSLVTDSSLCTFDLDTGTGAPGNTFRLLLTPDQSPSIYKLNASNPGQFYYNVFDGTTTAISFTVPYPFVTQGATPIHVYDSVSLQTVNGQTCAVPGHEIANSGAQITLNSYGSQSPGSTATATITFATPTDFAYANIHLDYGLKGTTGYAKGGSARTNCNTAPNDALDNVTLNLLIPDCQTYQFSETDGGADSQVASSRNEFKKDPGVAGFVQRANTLAPASGVQVVISGDGKTQTVTTDDDGWYMWSYKYTGKATPFTVTLPAYNLSQTVTVKSNGFVVASPFQLP